MATLNENIAEIKTIFRDIRDEINNNLPDDGGKLSSESDLYIYPQALSIACTERFEAGRHLVLDNSKYIPKTATGKVIPLTDVSEVSHSVSVYGDNQRVEVYGKNLLPYPYYETTKTQNGLTITDNGDGSITVNGTATALTNFAFVNHKTFTLPAGTYGFSLTPQVSNSYYLVSGSSATGVVIKYANGNRIATTEGGLTGDIVLQIKAGVTLNNVTFYPQIEAGDISNYEPYTHQTINVHPAGTSLWSMCPNMTFIADSDITVDYYSSFGMQTEYDRFWDVFQDNGNRTDYGSAFQSWEDVIFKPKYDIIPLNSAGSIFLKSKILDVRKSLEDCGVILDTSRATGLSYLVNASSTKSLPRIDLSLCAASSALKGSFQNALSLEIIEEIVSSENTLFLTDTFTNTTSLTHVIFSGVIASDINLQWSPLLDDESLISLAVALYNFVQDELNLGMGVFTKTITLSEESRAILEATLYPDAELSCLQALEGKGWNVE